MNTHRPFRALSKIALGKMREGQLKMLEAAAFDSVRDSIQRTIRDIDEELRSRPPGRKRPVWVKEEITGRARGGMRRELEKLPVELPPVGQQLDLFNDGFAMFENELNARKGGR